jgi:death-on-curing protein
MISLNEVLFLHEKSIGDFGGASGIRDYGLLESAVERPLYSFEGEELYPSPFTKAAAILESIVKNHPFVDGNKRTGWLACGTALRIYGYRFTLTEEEAYDFVIKVASSLIQFADIVLYIELHVESVG